MTNRAVQQLSTHCPHNSKFHCMQVSAKLCRFDALGPNFMELATRYRDLQEDLDHANFTLQEFRKAAEEEL